MSNNELKFSPGTKKLKIGDRVLAKTENGFILAQVIKTKQKMPSKGFSFKKRYYIEIQPFRNERRHLRPRAELSNPLTEQEINDLVLEIDNLLSQRKKLIEDYSKNEIALRKIFNPGPLLE